MQTVKQKYVQVKKYCTPNGEDEYFLLVNTEKDIPFEEQVEKIEQEYFETLKTLNIDVDSIVCRKFFLSDVANQIDILKRSRLYGEPASNIKMAIGI